jgi:hypothetical protein
MVPFATLSIASADWLGRGIRARYLPDRPTVPEAFSLVVPTGFEPVGCPPIRGDRVPKSGEKGGGAMVLSVIRFAILVVLTLIVVSLVVALARPETGVIEKLFLAGGVLAVIVVAAPVRRIGAKA